jgi:hypothetical protein
LNAPSAWRWYPYIHRAAAANFKGGPALLVTPSVYPFKSSDGSADNGNAGNMIDIPQEPDCFCLCFAHRGERRVHVS